MAVTKFKKYNTTVQEYSTSQNIKVVKDCKAIAILNVGDTIAELDGVPVFPSATPATVAGDFFEFSGDEGEVFTGSISLSFRPVIGAAPRVIIIQQFYVENYI